MNQVISGTAVASYPPAVSTVARNQQSLLFPTLLKRIEVDRRLSVLEIGPALPETIEFFSQYKCRLHFAGMYSDPILQMQSDDCTEADLTEHLKSSLDFPKSTRFDLCLFWDFLNYLDDTALRALNTVLAPHLHKTTRAHAFTVRTLETSFANQYYGIEQAHMFRIRPRNGRQAATFPHTQAILVNLLSTFDIDQGMLLPDGRLEVVMSAAP